MRNLYRVLSIVQMVWALAVMYGAGMRSEGLEGTEVVGILLGVNALICATEWNKKDGGDTSGQEHIK